MGKQQGKGSRKESQDQGEKPGGKVSGADTEFDREETLEVLDEGRAPNTRGGGRTDAGNLAKGRQKARDAGEKGRRD